MNASTKPALDLAGNVLEGSYRLVRLIGRGGMGAVYEAIQLRLNKRVAIKLMSRELASNMVSLARFHREAEITSQLGHPHLVNVVDFGTAETGEPYLVMEYLEGEDLEMRLQRVGRLPLDAVVSITKQVASALGAAHAQDVVHRDMKPANVFLLHVPGEPEFVKVLDFGISKVKAARARLTRQSSVVGTPCYMSPEQATGRVDETDHRADQWALACIAWEMLCGTPPFNGDDVNALFFQITRIDPPSLARLSPEVTPQVEGVIRRALSKRPEDRFPSVREFAHAFERAATGRSSDSTPAPVSASSPAGMDASPSSRSGQVAVTTGTPPGQAAYSSPSSGSRQIPPVASAEPGQFQANEDTAAVVNGTRRRLAVASGIAAAVVIIAVGVILIRPGSTSPATTAVANPAPPLPGVVTTPVPTQPSSVRPLVEPVPSPPDLAPVPVKPELLAKSTHAKSSGKAKPAVKASKAAHGSSKSGSSSGSVKPKIFQEL